MSTDVTQDDIDQFNDEGYLFIQDFMDEERIERLRKEANRLLELAVNSSLAHGRTSSRLNMVERENGDQYVRQVSPTLDITKIFNDLARYEVADVLSSLMGEPAISIERTAQVNYKMPLPEPVDGIDASQRDERYHVHSDWAYYKHGGYPRGIITSAIFLDACNEDSGPLEVWPGTQSEEIEHTRVEDGDLEASPEEIDHDDGMTVLGPPGSFLCFHSELIHGSGPNESDLPRRLAIFGHAPESTVDTEIVEGSARPETGTKYPSELRESRYEWEYQRMKEEGEFTDKFTAPTFYS